MAAQPPSPWTASPAASFATYNNPINNSNNPINNNNSMVAAIVSQHVIK